MTGSKYYFTWSIGYATIIIGVICLISNLIFWIGENMGLTPYAQSFSYRYSHDTPHLGELANGIIIGVVMIGVGYLLLIGRKWVLGKLSPSNEIDDGGILSDIWLKQKYTTFGIIGGFISTFGLLWFLFLSFMFLHAVSNERYCTIYPDAEACIRACEGLSGCGLDSKWLEESLTTAYFLSATIGFMGIPLFIGQVIVIGNAFLHIKSKKGNIIPSLGMENK